MCVGSCMGPGRNLSMLPAQAFSNSRGLAEDLARWFFQQLIVALDFCHRKGIANRDIKLEVRAPCTPASP